MTTEEAFIADILEHPADDAPRLIYADWLDDQGDPAGTARAEFIRLQIERHHREADEPDRGFYLGHPDVGGVIPHVGPHPGPGKRPHQRELELLGLHGTTWMPRLGKNISMPVIRRGFIEDVFTSAALFLRRGENLFRRVPLRRVGLSPSESMISLPDSPLLARLEGVVLADNGSSFNDSQRELFLSSPHLGNLRELDLGHDPSGPAMLRRLLDWPGLDHLTRLTLDCRLDDGAVRVLARSPRLANISVLNLASNSISDAGAKALAQSRYLGNLAGLDLSRNPIGDRGVAALINSDRLHSLRILNLRSNRVGTTGVVAIARSHGLGRLSSLDLRDNPIGPDGEEELRAASASTTVWLGDTERALS